MVLAFIFCVIFAFTLTAQVTPKAADNTYAHVSFARMAQAASQYMNGRYNDYATDSGYSLYSSPQHVGSAGGVLGYQHGAHGDAEFNLGDQNAINEVSYSVASLSTADSRFASSRVGPHYMGPYTGYWLLGTSLSQMGLDEVRGVSSTDNYRGFVYLITSALYLMSISLSAFFQLVFSMLKFANPFRLFFKSSTLQSTWGGIPTGQDWNATTINSHGNVVGAFTAGLSQVADNISGIYDTLYGLSMAVIIPVTIAITLFVWLLVKKGRQAGSTLKGLLIKVVFVCVGIPLMFMCYDTVICQMSDLSATKQAAGTKIIASTFFDFERWVYSGDIGADATSFYESSVNYMDMRYISPVLRIDSNTKLVSNYSLSKVRSLCYKMNAQYGAITGSTMLDDSDTYFQSYNTSGDLQSYHADMVKYMYTTDVNANDVTDDTISTILYMLERYGGGDIVTPGGFATRASSIGTESSDPYSIVVNQLSSNRRMFDEKIAGGYNVEYSNEAYVGSDIIVDYASDRFKGGRTSDIIGPGTTNRNDNRVELTKYYDKTNVERTHGFAYDLWGHGNLCIYHNADGQYYYYGCNGTTCNASVGLNGYRCFSPMTIYNYLSSNFSNEGVVAYSAELSSSSAVKGEHYAVTTVGSGLMKIIYLLDAITLMGCLTVIGYGYGFAMLFGNFKAIFKMIGDVMSGMLGSMRGIASVVILTLAMIIEIIVTCVLYTIVSDILLEIYNIIESPIAMLLQAFTTSVENDTFTTIITPLLGIIVIVLIITITLKLLTWRHAVVKATTETAAAMVNKFMNTNVVAPDLSANASGTAGLLGAAGIAAGLGMAAEGGALSGDKVAEGMHKDGWSQFAQGATGMLADNAQEAYDTINDKTGGKLDAAKEKLANDYGVSFGNGSGSTTGKDGEDISNNENPFEGMSDKQIAEDVYGVQYPEENAGADTDANTGANATANNTEAANPETTTPTDSEVTDGTVSDGGADGSGDAGSNGDANTTANNSVNLAKNGDGTNIEGDDVSLESAIEAANEADSNSPDFRPDNPDTAANNYIDQNEQMFLESLNGDSAGTTDIDTLPSSDSSEKYVTGDAAKDVAANITADTTPADAQTDGSLKVDTSGDSAIVADASNPAGQPDGKLSVDATGGAADNNPTYTLTNPDGSTTACQIVNSDTGLPYTAADAAAGANYTVLGSDGQVHVDANGNAFENMGAVTMMTTQSGQILSVVGPDGSASAVTAVTTGTTTAKVDVASIIGGQSGSGNQSGNGNGASNPTNIVTTAAVTAGGVAGTIIAQQTGNQTVSAATQSFAMINARPDSSGSGNGGTGGNGYGGQTINAYNYTSANTSATQVSNNSAVSSANNSAVVDNSSGGASFTAQTGGSFSNTYVGGGSSTVNASSYGNAGGAVTAGGTGGAGNVNTTNHGDFAENVLMQNNITVSVAGDAGASMSAVGSGGITQIVNDNHITTAPVDTGTPIVIGDVGGQTVIAADTFNSDNTVSTAHTTDSTINNTSANTPVVPTEPKADANKPDEDDEGDGLSGLNGLLNSVVDRVSTVANATVAATSAEMKNRKSAKKNNKK